MAKKLKRCVLSDESINSYGYRVLTSGIDLSAFRKNPLLLWGHYRDEGSARWCNYLPIGHWEDIEVKDGVLSACPVFDCTDELSQTICDKYEAGTLSASSIGFRIKATSSEKKHLLPGQTRETVTKCELIEASIVDIPANKNACRLYDRSTSALLAAGAEAELVPELNLSKPMKFKDSFTALLSFLKISKEAAPETDITEAQLEDVNKEMERLQSENGTLKNTISSKEAEISTLTNQVSQLTEQVNNLKGAPAPTTSPAPSNEPEGKTLTAEDEMLDFASKTEDTVALAAKMREAGYV